MKEFLTIVVSFLVVVALAFYMYVSNQKHSVAMIENKKLQEMINQNNEDLKREIEELRSHVKMMDSLYHK